MEDHAALLRLAGHVKVELFDELTRKKIKETEGKNLFTNYGLERFKRYSHFIIGGQFAANCYFNEYSAAAEACQLNGTDSNFGFMRYLYLTDNVSAVSATDDVVKGTVTGYASREPYTDSDVLRGSINQNESILIPGSFKAVFDFGTDRGNGTHGSVFWSAFTNTSYDNMWCFDPYNSNPKLARQYARVCEGSDGYLYGILSETLYKIDPSTLEELATYTLSTAYGGADIDVFDVSDGVCYYTASGEATLQKYNISTATQTTISITPGIAPYGGGCVIDGYLYAAYSYGSYIMKFNVSTGEYTSNTLPSSSYYIYRKGSALYIGYSDGFYSYDYDTNVRTFVGGFGNSGLIGNVSTLSNFLYLYTANSYYDGINTRSNYLLLKSNLTRAGANAITAKLLDSPVTKNNTQTMKVTYTITIN